MPQVTLRRREPVAEGTLAFYFDKPAGFSHDAGQNVMLSLVEPPAMDASGPSRPFTLASAPHEPELMIATRMRDSTFKRHLGSVPLGTRSRTSGCGLRLFSVTRAPDPGRTPRGSSARLPARRGRCGRDD